MLQIDLEVEDHEVLTLQSSSRLLKPVSSAINPQRSMRKMTREMDVDEKTMRNVVKTDLKLSLLKMQTCQNLTDLKKEKKIDPSEDSSQQTERWYGHL